MADQDRETGLSLDLKLDANGLIPAIVQDHETGAVLMMAWMNRHALESTLESGKATFYSRSRDKVWVKGESSGHTQEVIEARVDCDQDVVLLRCKSNGPACHVGFKTCFFRAIEDDVQTLRTVEEPVFDPESVYGSK